MGTFARSLRWDGWAAQCMAPEWPSRQQASVDSAYARFGISPQDSRGRGARSDRQVAEAGTGQAKESAGKTQKELQARPDLQRPPHPCLRERNDRQCSSPHAQRAVLG